MDLSKMSLTDLRIFMNEMKARIYDITKEKELIERDLMLISSELYKRTNEQSKETADMAKV